MLSRLIQHLIEWLSDHVALSSAIRAADMNAVASFLKDGILTRKSVLVKETPLLLATRLGRIKIINALLAAGVDPLECSGKAILLVSDNGNLRTLETLLKGIDTLKSIPGYPLESVNIILNRALLVSVGTGNRETCSMLLDYGASADAREESILGLTALTSAALRGDAEIVGLLVSRNADVNALARNGWSPLMAASARGHVPVLGILLKAGADKSMKHRYGATSLDFAKSAKCSQAVELLSSWNEESQESGRLNRDKLA